MNTKSLYNKVLYDGFRFTGFSYYLFLERTYQDENHRNRPQWAAQSKSMTDPTLSSRFSRRECVDYRVTTECTTERGVPIDLEGVSWHLKLTKREIVPLTEGSSCVFGGRRIPDPSLRSLTVKVTQNNKFRSVFSSSWVSLPFIWDGELLYLSHRRVSLSVIIDGRNLWYMVPPRIYTDVQS